ncbi:hypothetical protein CL673_02595 [Candidatus Bathyarchaeota archaeon]|nr:hypothetical protein [Candidatus Bathyarchaeota archaeon]MDP6049248.1 DUF371 domain-containing protein [Candidatus Bathyarchaeota archaeon]
MNQQKREAEDSFTAWGHANITSKHSTTIMVTTDKYLSRKGDCILAVHAERGLKDISPELKDIIKNEKAEVIFIMETGNQSLVVRGKGHPRLTLASPSDIVIRKSNFICNRTLMIKADKSSSDIPLEFVSLLHNHHSKVNIKIRGIL